jgi:uncharacterized membrane protein YphA (DoxX/SURF4 family)
MLALFPSLLSWALLAPFIIRFVLGITLIHFAFRHYKAHQRTTALGFGILGILILIGFLTQLAATLTSIVFIVLLVHKMKRGAFMSDGVNYYLLLLGMALSLLFSGAGLYAIDWPL